MKIAAIVQARMTSTRLPGKVMMPLAGEPMLARVIQRLERTKRITEIIVATSVNTSDDSIDAYCKRNKIHIYRGSESDVLSRYVGAANDCCADAVVRITSDCPLLEPRLVDWCVDEYLSNKYDYVSNTHPQTWPYGLAVEVFSIDALLLADKNGLSAEEREHVTPHLYWNPTRFRLKNIFNDVDLSAHRWTVDTPEDYQFVKYIFENLKHLNSDFDLNDVLKLLDKNPEWLQINQSIQQKTLSH